jgi:integrase
MTRPATGHVLLRKDKQGRSTWYVKYRQPDGHQRKKRLAPAWTERGNPPSGYLTKKQAEGELRTLLADLDRGKGMVVKTGATFDDAAAEYLRYVEQDRERDAVTVRDYAGVVNGYLLPWFGGRAIEAITHEDVAAYRDALKREGRAVRKVEGEPTRTGKLSNRTIVRHLTVLHSIFKRAHQVWSGLPENPASASLVERPRLVYDGSFDLLDPDEARLLAEQAPDEQTRALYLLPAFTGLRQGEVFALRWRHVDWASGRLHVKENWSDKTLKITKGKKARSVPMTPEVMLMLDRLSQRENLTEPDDLIFPAPGGGYLDDMAVRRAFYKALDAAGLNRVRFHDLRHTFGTQAVKVLPLADVQAIMGHAHISTTMRYVHYKPGHDEGAKLAGAFASTADAGVPRGPERGPEPGRIDGNSAQLSEPEMAL